MFDFSRSKNKGEVKIACDRFYFMNHESQINIMFIKKKISEKLINKKNFLSLDILKKVIAKKERGKFY